MNILSTKEAFPFINPQINIVGKCRFRQYPTEIPATRAQKLLPYLDNDDEMINCAELEDDIEIKLTKSGKFLTQFHVASAFHGSIIGAKGMKRREIEMDTDTKIKVPKPGESGDIVITGSSERNVSSARVRVQMIVLQMRDLQPLTHFISIPVVSDEIKSKFQQFKLELLNGPPLRGVDETIFQNPDKLHLTIAPLVLLDDIEFDLAVKTLHECKEEIIEPLFKNVSGLKVILEGLEIMNDDPTNVDVLYGKVKLNISKYNSSFQKLADQIVEFYARKGLIRKQFDSVKLHVTLMNSLFRQSGVESSSTNSNKNREAFDASYILKKYRNYHFGEANLSNIHLSIRYTKAHDNYFDSLTTISINS